MTPGLGRSPGGGNGKPLQYSCLGNPTDRGPWQAAVHGVAEESDVTEQLHQRAGEGGHLEKMQVGCQKVAGFLLRLMKPVLKLIVVTVAQLCDCVNDLCDLWIAKAIKPLEERKREDQN